MTEREQELWESLAALSETAREFSTEADYTVSGDVEDDFVAALEHAEQLLDRVNAA